MHERSIITGGDTQSQPCSAVVLDGTEDTCTSAGSCHYTPAGNVAIQRAACVPKSAEFCTSQGATHRGFRGLT
jgi:hypothetical protein